MDDLISRQAAIKVIEDAHHNTEVMSMMDNGKLSGLGAACNIIRNLPSAEPERKKGKWVLFDNQKQEDISNGNYMYTCTNCLHSDVHSKSVVVPYCWHCGAKMGD